MRLIHDNQEDTIYAVLCWLIERGDLSLDAAEAALRAVGDEAHAHAEELRRFMQERKPTPQAELVRPGSAVLVSRPPNYNYKPDKP
jgi:hypothetical protein